MQSISLFENASSWDGYALCKGQLKGGKRAFCKPYGINPCPVQDIRYARKREPATISLVYMLI